MSNFIDGMNMFLDNFVGVSLDRIVHFIGYATIPVLILLVVIAIACITHSD